MRSRDNYAGAVGHEVGEGALDLLRGRRVVKSQGRADLQRPVMEGIRIPGMGRHGCGLPCNEIDELTVRIDLVQPPDHPADLLTERPRVIRQGILTRDLA
jgi:hypothetical protein